MITITRSLARKLRAVFRRASLKPRSTLAPPVFFKAGAEGLRIRAMTPDVAIEYHLPGEYPVDELTVALELFDDCQGKRDEPVTLESRPKKRTFATWQDGDIPQTIGYAAELVKRKFPEIPPILTVVDPAFWPALRDAAECTDPNSTRYALSNIQLSGDRGEVCGTNGRQIFQHGGFQFPWTGDVMVLALGVLGCAELAVEGSIEIGKTEKELVLRLGRWTLVLALDTVGRFPKLEEVIQRAEAGTTLLHLTPSDAQFLAGALPKLPQDEIGDGAMTLDLNGQPYVRAQSAKGTPLTELVLTNATLTGDPIRIEIDRRYLLRALKLGLTELRFSDPQKAILAADERRKFIWMPLSPEGALGPVANAVRIESPPAGAVEAQSPSQPKRRRMTKSNTTTANTAAAVPTKSEPIGNAASPSNGEPLPNDAQASSSQGQTNGAARRTRNRKAGRPPNATTIEQAIALRDALRDSVNKTNELIRTLNRQKQQNRLVQSTLASLKQLQQAG